MKILGHPIHPMLVHFPTAFFAGSLLLDFAGVLAGEPTFWTASFYLQAMGVGAGILAAFFGAADYVGLAHREEVFQKATWHGSIQLVVVSIFGVLAGIRFQDFPGIEQPGTLYLTAGSVGVVLMIIGNYLGGDLVFRHGVGVEHNRGSR